jgi:hypothetical protein
MEQRAQSKEQRSRQPRNPAQATRERERERDGGIFDAEGGVGH